jgi:dTDP-4-dehydrorhamnose reductase
MMDRKPLAASGSPREGGRAPLALWGGLECTVVRVGDTFRDQSRETGHRERDGDLAAIASLGIRTLRYPVLWETVSPDDPERCDWAWHDQRLGQLRDLGIEPIAGLVHHGGGPVYTNLLDPAFPEKLAVHARRVAERYPWISQFTPVNEPLTTARFTGLYGHWYPHGQGYGPFLRALVNQCRGVQLSMRAIREVTPDARLVQTEDLGKTFSTPRLAYQAAHENERRWLGFDLLTGRVRPGHPFWQILLDHGIAAEELAAFVQRPCPPDIIGVNHYLTSERYLDQRTSRYPASARGGNGRDLYADVEAVRVPLATGDRGPAARLREVWERYCIPVAVTEAHLGCTRDEQLRWLSRVWDAALAVRGEGADIRAVTIWSMFGAVDWNSLLTRKTGFYEPGAFDVRGARPRRTALATAAAALARAGSFDHPVLDGPAWWERPNRFYRPVRSITEGRRAAPPRRILIIGDGRLGRAVADSCDRRGLAAVILGRPGFDPADADDARQKLETIRPWAVVNCCGFSGAIVAESEPDRCFRDNVVAATVLAEVCGRMGLPYAVLSSDQVFDGSKSAAYVESDPTRPRGLFGLTKEQSEQGVLEAHQAPLILRTGPLFGAGRPEMLAASLQHAARAAGVPLDRNLVVSPTFIPDLVHALLDLLIDRADGVWHLTNVGEVDARELLELTGLSELGEVQAAWSCATSAASGVPGGGRSGCNLSLTSERSLLLPSLGAAFDRFRPEAFSAAG